MVEYWLNSCCMMTEPEGVGKEPVRGIDWDNIFRRRPDLEAPGYRETFHAMKLKRKAGDGSVQ
jgi:hypothetical protein